MKFKYDQTINLTPIWLTMFPKFSLKHTSHFMLKYQMNRKLHINWPIHTVVYIFTYNNLHRCLLQSLGLLIIHFLAYLLIFAMLINDFTKIGYILGYFTFLAVILL